MNFEWDWYVSFLNNLMYYNNQMHCLLNKKINMQVNIIVATSILEEGLDVQRCNLVIRFDPCPTVCSFIQSRGRARMRNSDYILMVKRYFFFYITPSVLLLLWHLGKCKLLSCMRQNYSVKFICFTS